MARALKILPSGTPVGCFRVFLGFNHGFIALGQDILKTSSLGREHTVKDAPVDVPPSDERSGCSPTLPYPLDRRTHSCLVTCKVNHLLLRASLPEVP